MNINVLIYSIVFTIITFGLWYWALVTKCKLHAPSMTNSEQKALYQLETVLIIGTLILSIIIMYDYNIHTYHILENLIVMIISNGLMAYTLKTEGRFNKTKV